MEDGDEGQNPGNLRSTVERSFWAGERKGGIEKKPHQLAALQSGTVLGRRALSKEMLGRVTRG